MPTFTVAWAYMHVLDVTIGILKVNKCQHPRSIGVSACSKCHNWDVESEKMPTFRVIW